MIMPAGMTILTRAAGPQRIGRVMSIIGVPMLLGPILGPILGGWLVADVSWRWIFFINVPIGFVALALALRILPRDVAAHDQKLDYVDFLLLSPGLALAIYGLAETNSAGGFGSAKVLMPLLAGIALLVAFVWHALRASRPARRPAAVQGPDVRHVLDDARARASSRCSGPSCCSPCTSRRCAGNRRCRAASCSPRRAWAR